MARTSRDQVIQLYREVLGREPYESELAPGGWVDQHARSGLSVDQLRQEFQNSDEARQRAGGGSAEVAAAPVDPMEAQRKMIADWYGMKPTTPAGFQYSAEQTAADKLMVGQELRPEYQEQATQYGQDYTRALQNARQGFSRRGLWGAAGEMEQTIDPATGLAYTTATAPTAGGVRSGLREVGETRLAEESGRATTAFGRAYTEATAQETKGRELEAETTYKRQITEPYEIQMKEWERQHPGYYYSAQKY